MPISPRSSVAMSLVLPSRTRSTRVQAPPSPESLLAVLDDCRAGHGPEDHRDQKRPVFEKIRSGAAASLAAVNDVEEAEDAVDHERQRQHQQRAALGRM